MLLGILVSIIALFSGICGIV